MAWLKSSSLIQHNRGHEAFSTLVDLAILGDTEAQFFAHEIIYAHKSYATRPKGVELAEISVESAPFKQIKNHHPATKLLADMAKKMKDKAKEGHGHSALILALFNISGKKTTKNNKNTHRNTAKAIEYFNIALQDLNFKPSQYHRKLIAKTIIDLVDSVEKLPSRNDVETIKFPDGSKVSVTLLCNVTQKAQALSHFNNS
ncbi:MAG: hypothetical protein PHD48_10535 [Alphaproteobacteria bacterium]|nr:hypothetical protein [Alphaproteobacteria bacterium]